MGRGDRDGQPHHPAWHRAGPGGIAVNAPRPRTRIQRRNRKLILDAALDVFSAQGYRGATLDQIAASAGLSKPNLLYYFDNKEEIHRTLLTDLLDAWLAPLHDLAPDGDPQAEILGYVRRKLQMSREYPRESRLFANEILQGAPRIEGFIRGDLKALVDEKAAVIRGWAAQGRIADLDPYHLIFSIWALTQHYADFEAQMRMVRGEGVDTFEGAESYLDTLFARLIAP
ncbi:TetR family transcriptional regulator [Rhodobacteraceae bacterium WD3A24]|nr:TetR family transcriptional regulator [Rhodobacteraceae bacterium WD3A24]